MAFNFYGVFTSGQFDELEAFSRIQGKDIKDRIAWLSAAAQRNGLFRTEYDPETGYPLSFTVSPSTSYGAKLMAAYRILGGVPERDMLLRTSDDPVFLTRGSNVSKSTPDSTVEGGYSDLYSNGRRYRGNQRFDRDIGIQVDKLKRWQLEAVKHKREHLEFKIKRALDYTDQLLNELALLRSMVADGSESSVDQQITNLVGLFYTPGRANVIDDSEDKFGLDIGRIGDQSVPNEIDIARGEALR
ncbi:MAG: hypothetical protein BWY99_02377 [Synergistetes bacterium ADurb.BinA166]|nr:MAG: hypothetical protein BWY99_02377 [Synergistetes bacterium ADurb.BinA166]